MKNNKTRESNFELLRIISMFLIILWHTIIFGNGLNSTQQDVSFVFRFLICICVMHVSLFVLLTGYFQINSKFKLKKYYLYYCK